MTGAPQPVSRPEIDAAVVRRVTADDDLVAVFRAQAEDVGMHVQLTSPASVGSDITALVGRLKGPQASTCPGRDRDKDAPTAKVVIDPTLDCCEEIEHALPENVDILDPNAGDDAMYAADVGITGVRAAVAETGTLVCASGEHRWRGMSLIPPVHVAVVRADQILPDLLDLFAGLSAAELPADLALISGPSKTADIEGILITGVHGPGEVYVLIVKT